VGGDVVEAASDLEARRARHTTTVGAVRPPEAARAALVTELARVRVGSDPLIRRDSDLLKRGLRLPAQRPS
jgi:hypothetical protein